jgi:hypothetical protein
MRSGSVTKNGERYPQSNCIRLNCGDSLALEEVMLPSEMAPDPRSEQCGTFVSKVKVTLSL